MIVFSGSKTSWNRFAEWRLAHREAEVFHNFHHHSTRNRELQQLETATGIQQGNFLEKLHQAGFRRHNILALTVLPIARTAWASGSVSDDEYEVATQSLVGFGFYRRRRAMGHFKSWLQRRPPRDLDSLWEGYVTHRLERRQRPDRFGRQLVQACERVAMASGGVLGIGKICTAERETINRVAQVYRLAQQ